MGILQKISAFKRKATPRVINDVEFLFYPVRLTRLLRGDVQEAVAPLVEAVAVFTGAAEGIRPKTSSVVDNKEEVMHNQVEEISVQMADWMQAQRRNAAKMVTQSFVSEKTQLVIGRVLCDSLRDDFPANPDDDTVLEFMQALDLGDLVQFCIGFF